MYPPQSLETSITPGSVYSLHTGNGCAAKECPFPATWQPIVSLRPKRGADDYAMEMEVSMGLCNSHCETAKLSDIVPADAFSYIGDILRSGGKTRPCKKRMALRWVPFPA